MSFTPMAHQVRSLDFLRANDAVFDMSDCGTGKTLVEIVDFDRHGKKAMLVLAPKTILETAWANDIKKFAPHLKVSVAYAENREKAFAADADVYVTNIDATTWLAKQSPKFFGKFERLVLDEASKMKHATSQRSKAAAKIVKHFPIKRLMSGTPNSRSVTDLWHQVFLLDGGQRLGKSFFGFRNSVCDPVQVGPNPNMCQWVDREHAADAVFALLSDLTIRHKFENCVDIPENHSYAVSFKLPPKLRKAYEQMKALNIAELSNSKVITAMNAAIVAGKLLQIASGACVAHDTPVLTHNGWKPIQAITSSDLVWDGEDWTPQKGAIFKGEQATDECFGVRMTNDHEVLTTAGWKTAKEVNGGKSGEKFTRAEVRLPGGYTPRRNVNRENEKSPLAVQVRLRQFSNPRKSVLTRKTQNNAALVRLSARKRTTQDDRLPPVSYMGQHEKKVPERNGQRFSALRRARYNRVRALGRFLRDFLGGHAQHLRRPSIPGQNGQRRAVLARKLPLGNSDRTSIQHAHKRVAGHTGRKDDGIASRRPLRHKTRNTTRTTVPLQMVANPRIEPVYDLLNCGPRRRFTVMDNQGLPLIVHNCYDEEGQGQMIATDRYELVGELVEARQHSVVFFHWKHQREQLEAEFKKRKLRYAVIDGTVSTRDRVDAEKYFQGGFYDAILCQPQSAGHGITLTKATATIWASPCHDTELWVQGLHRVYRTGQKNKTENIVIVAEGTYDEKAYDNCMAKKQRMTNLLELFTD